MNAINVTSSLSASKGHLTRKMRGGESAEELWRFIKNHKGYQPELIAHLIQNATDEYRVFDFLRYLIGIEYEEWDSAPESLITRPLDASWPAGALERISKSDRVFDRLRSPKCPLSAKGGTWWDPYWQDQFARAGMRDGIRESDEDFRSALEAIMQANRGFLRSFLPRREKVNAGQDQYCLGASECALEPMITQLHTEMAERKCFISDRMWQYADQMNEGYRYLLETVGIRRRIEEVYIGGGIWHPVTGRSIGKKRRCSETATYKRLKEIVIAVTYFAIIT